MVVRINERERHGRAGGRAGGQADTTERGGMGKEGGQEGEFIALARLHARKFDKDEV